MVRKNNGRMNGLSVVMIRICLVIFIFSTFLTSCTEDSRKKPNFLFILVDDQSPFDLKTYDPNSILETPNIDRLAQDGMVFESARHMGSWSGAVCAPSRHMIMSGRTLWHLPSRGSQFVNEQSPDSLELQTMGAVFKRSGYKTMRTCKIGNSYKAANAQFEIVKDATKRGGTDESGSAWHSKQVLDYLGERQEDDVTDPFLIYFGFSHPHDVRDGTPELLSKYGAINHRDTSSLPPANPKQPPLQENYLPAHPFFHGHPKLRDEERVPGVWKNRDERTVRNELGREYACSENIDIQIGKVLKKLEEMGELDNTYIIYTADHGMSIGRHGLMGKQNLYEHTWRIPFIIKGPNIESGKRVEGNIYLLDVLPTLCELAEIVVPNTVEGMSFGPVISGQQEAIRDVMYGVYSGGTKPGMRCVKKGDWKLIKYDMMDGEVSETQLFNLVENPHEYLAEHRQGGEMMTNLANNPKYADKLMEMEETLLQQMTIYEDPYRLWNQSNN